MSLNCKQCILRQTNNDYAKCLKSDSLKHRMFDPYTGDLTKQATPYVLALVFILFLLSGINVILF